MSNDDSYDFESVSLDHLFEAIFDEYLGLSAINDATGEPRSGAFGSSTSASSEATDASPFTTSASQASTRSDTSTSGIMFKTSCASLATEFVPTLPLSMDTGAVLEADVRSSPSSAVLKARKALLPKPAVRPQRKPRCHPVTCQKCHTRFSRKSDLVRHMRDVHEDGGIIFRCKQCKHAKFGRRDKVLEHFRNQHHGQVSIDKVANDLEAVAALHSSCRRKKVKKPVGELDDGP